MRYEVTKDETMPLATTAEIPELSREQLEAVERLLDFPRAVRTLGGYAGTGKTTVVRHLTEELPRYRVCAYTGKAAHVLRRKGIDASTIHSLIYKPEEETYKDAKGRVRTRIVFRLKRELLGNPRGFIVDEASMVGETIFNDLRSFGLPIIFVGDHGQLEPVGDRDFNLMARPDVTLDTVHRNAGEIAHFAEFIRQGNKPIDWIEQRPDQPEYQVRFLTLSQATQRDKRTLQYGQIICAFNKTRVIINKYLREDALDYPVDRPVVGDRVMCLQNDAGSGVFNGMQGVIDGLFGDEMDFGADGESYRVRYLPEQFNRTKRPDYSKDGRLPFDYCYAITCHKAQGDEFDDVLVLEQKCPAWDHARWAYTAASRARQKLTWVEG
jgi:exodeoxyribonuclease V